MSEQIIEKIFSIIKSKYTSERKWTKNPVSYFFCRLFLVLLLVTANYLLIVFMNKFLMIHIQRLSMLIYVTFSELFVLYSCTKYSFYKNLFKQNNHCDKTNKIINFYIDIGLSFHQSLIYNFYMVLPFLFAYGVYRNAHIIFYINSIIAIPFLSLITAYFQSILAKLKLTTKYYASIVGQIIISIISIQTYMFFCCMFGFDISVNVSSIPLNNIDYNSLEGGLFRMFQFPMEIAKVCGFDIVNIIFSHFEFLTKNLLDIMIFTGLICAIIGFSVSCVQKITLFNKHKPVITNKLIHRIKYNNTKVFRINHTIRYCMPLSPPTIQQ